MDTRPGSSGSHVRRWLVPSYGTILVLASLANVLLLRGASLFAWDGDGARHLRLGHLILQTGAVPTADPFSYTRAGAPLLVHEWLSEVFLAWADRLAGLPGVAVLTALLFTAAVYGSYRVALALGARRPFALGVGLLALLLQSMHLLARPHMFTTAFAAVFMIVLIRHARGGHPRRLFLLPLLMLPWANLHGGFLLGFVLLGAFAVAALLRSQEFADPERSLRWVLATLVVCGLVSLVNPAGAHLWSYTTGHLGGDDFLLAATREFQSIDFHQGYGKLFFVALVAGPLLWMTGRVRVSWLSGGLYLFFAASSLYSARNVPLFTVAALPWLAVWAEEALSEGASARSVMNRIRKMDTSDRLLRPWPWLAVAAAIVALALGPLRDHFRYDPRRFPVEALQHLDDLHVSGHMFNQIQWGGYILYARPGLPVFIDGQTDFYGEELSRDYLHVINGSPSWREILERYDVMWTLTATAAPLNQLLALDPAWERSYSDEEAVIFRRLSGARKSRQ